jgi:hypothetical protein
MNRSAADTLVHVLLFSEMIVLKAAAFVLIISVISKIMLVFIFEA